MSPDPVAIVPMYCSDLFSDWGRLGFCLIVHPMILEVSQFLARRTTYTQTSSNLSVTSPQNQRALDFGHSVWEETMFTSGNEDMLLEAILTFNRRFMLR